MNQMGGGIAGDPRTSTLNDAVRPASDVRTRGARRNVYVRSARFADDLSSVAQNLVW
jgi:hypothetical protein